MDTLDQLIKETLEPYLIQIQELQQKQQDKEAEIITLKYAMLEMDRKYQELEKKLAQYLPKKAISSTTNGRSSSRTTAIRGTNVSQTQTQRSQSKITTLQQVVPRERSKTPTAKGMQNTLNSTSKIVKPTERSTSRTKNTELQSQTALKKSSLTKKNQEEQKKQQSVANSPKKTDIKNTSRVSSRQETSKERMGNSSLLSQRRSLHGFTNEKSVNSSLQKVIPDHNEGITLNINTNLAIQVNFGKQIGYVYAWEKKPIRNDPSIKPNVDLKLCYVPSYNGMKTGNNIHFIDHFNISSTIVILMNVDTYEQRLLQGHTDEIQCIAYQKENKILCTGQMNNSKQKDPFFILWDLLTYKKIAIVGYHQKQISHVAFDERGIYLVTLCGSENQYLAVWKLQNLIDVGKQQKGTLKNQQPICEYMIGKLNINTFQVDNNHSDINILNFVFGTEQGIKFYTANIQENTIEEKKATLSSSEGIQSINSVTFSQDDILAAGNNGVIYSFRQDKVADNQFKVGNRAIQCIGNIEIKGKSYLMALLEDGKLSFWEGQNLIEQIDLIDDDIKIKLGAENPKLKPKAFAYQNGVFIIGFQQNLVLKYDMNKNQKEILITCSFQSPQQITAYPKTNAFATVGYDKYLRIYSYQALQEQNKSCLVNTVELQNQGKSCDFSPNGKFLTVGYDNGIFEVFKVQDNNGEYFQLECLKLFDLNRKKPINCVKFSPNGRYLVISCHKDLVVFNAQTEEFEQEGLLKGNQNMVTFLQFDKKSEYAMTNSIDCQVLVWELLSGSFQKIDPFKVKDIEWDKKQCIYSWDTLGIWNPELNETDINVTCVSNDKQLVVAGDNLGQARILCYPAHLPKQQYISLEGHASHVKSAIFTNDDKYLITMGELDCTIMIWEYKANQHNILNVQDADLNADLELIDIRNEKHQQRNGTDDESLLD